MSSKVYNVLFLCTGNSARSIMAEALMTHWGNGLWQGYSAGNAPKDAVHPLCLALLQQAGVKSDGLHPKNWDLFTKPDAPEMDYVFTLCDLIAAEPRPAWPGQPIIAHWGLPDPELAEGTQPERMLAFRDVFRMLERRIQLLVALRHRELSRREEEREVSEIGREPATPEG
jgi:arsenate reductase